MLEQEQDCFLVGVEAEVERTPEQEEPLELEWKMVLRWERPLELELELQAVEEISVVVDLVVPVVEPVEPSHFLAHFRSQLSLHQEHQADLID